MINNKKIEVFCGTGGVGKTTLASSRALYLSRNDKKILLITIDPSKRLKDILKLDKSMAGEVERVNDNLDALLMSPPATFKRLGKKHNIENDFDNYIIKILSKPYGGMNEIMAIMELDEHINDEKYDTIILDTPPGKHFLDFLDSCRRIKVFFDKNFVDIFQYLNKKEIEKTKIITKIISTGIKKLLKYFEKVTGAIFIEEFIGAVSVIYKAKESFISALELQSFLMDSKNCNWILVTSTEHGKIKEAEEIKSSAKNFLHKDSFIAINKCNNDIAKELKSIDNEKNPITAKTLNSILINENQVKEQAKSLFDNNLYFPDVLSESPSTHLEILSKSWSLYD